MVIKNIIFFILSFIAFAGFITSFVCLGGANDAYEKYPGGKIVIIKSPSSPQSSLSSLSSPQSLFSDVSASGEKDGRYFLSKEEEVGIDEVEESTVTPVMFLWHYTSAGVCFSVSAGIVVLALTVLFSEGKELCRGWLSLVAVIVAASLTVVPAVRMDEFSAATYWVFFIPYFLLALSLLAIPILYYYCIRETPCVRVVGASMFILTYLFLVAGLVLCILRLEGVLAPSFRYAIVFVLPAAAAICLGYPLWLQVPDMGTEGDMDEFDIVTVLWTTALMAAIVLVVYGGFFLPFTLRKDLFFHTSYHFTLIPYHILIVVAFVALGYLGVRNCKDGE